MTRWQVGCAAALFGLVGVAACARPYPPPGGETPRDEPAVIETVPDELAVDASFRGAVVFRFDRRISEQLEANPVVVSPLTSPVRVSRGRSEIRVTLEQGWEPGQIYRVVLLPGVRDLFNNRTTQPIELAFSTGPEIPATAIAGFIADRITGRPARDGMVEAIRLADSVPYLAPADTGGFFALRHLPVGEYDVAAFTDLNRNRRVDPNEPRSPMERVELAAATDTVPLLLSVLAPDTTPARLVAAQAMDSTVVRLSFDDYIDPDAALEDVTVRVVLLPDSARAPSGILLTPRQDAERRRAMAAADTIDADTAAAVLPPAVAAATPDASAEELPTRELVLVLDSPLLPGRQYLLAVDGVLNINAIPGGGGQATFEVPERRDPQPGPDRSGG
jgi:hypothetical protein